jgi:arginyl-tRNA synthetase
VTPADLDQALLHAVRGAVADGEFAGPVPEDTFLTWADGNYVTPLPMRLAGPSGRPPREVAEVIAGRLAGVGRVAVTGPGYLTITAAEPGALARHIVETPGYGAPGTTWPGEAWPDRPRTFDNPGFVVRFAYARAASVRRQARELGFGPGRPDGLDEPAEVRLLGLLAELPGRTARAAGEGDAARYKRHLVRIADAYHDVYERCPALPRGDEAARPRHGARLTLAEAVRIALNNGLRTLGETPKERI